MLNANTLLKKAIQQVKSAGITPGNIDPIVEINDKSTSRFGLCTKISNRKGPYDYKIQLNKILLNQDTEKPAMEVLVHEVLHSCKGCMNHGVVWKNHATTMNRKFNYKISRCSSLDTLGIESENVDAKYIIQCKKCENRVFRNRKSKLTENVNSYKCNCGGELDMIKGQPATQSTKAANSAPTSVVERVRAAKYIVVCQGCGAKTLRNRKSKLITQINNYRCSCGSKLKVITK